MRGERPVPEAEISTRRSLISRLRNLDDGESWQRFFDTYWKLIFSVARKAGLSEEEAQDVVQETTVAVARYIQDFRYDPAVCSFKNWLMHKTRWKIIDQVRKRPPSHVRRFSPPSATSRTAAVERVADPQSLEIEAVWEMEWQKNIVDAAMERIKRRINPVHYQIFFLSAVRKLAPCKIGEALGVHVAQVYVVKHRIAGLVRKEIQILESRKF